ncbi:hypothetical protein F4809DRAFT_640368 [Biscogniauxia mediterranea]|nr:hypothetical protein F4809DRAFT_640368 [Biscogniauxia mediterranea]
MYFIAFLCAALYSSVALSQLQHQALRTQVLSILGGKRCSDVGAKTRRQDDGMQYMSAKFEETGGGFSTNQLKLYREKDCGCLADASVFVAINARDLDAYDKDRSTPMMRDAPGEHGTTRYVDKRDSPKGEACDILKRVGDQIETENLRQV